MGSWTDRGYALSLVVLIVGAIVAFWGELLIGALIALPGVAGAYIFSRETNGDEKS